MCDGSLQKDKKTIILHTQGFSLKENSILSNELNLKFKLHTKVIPHKKKYYVIQTSKDDGDCIYKLIFPYVICSMEYKLPCFP
jgi:LAGLIDADG DNA endonuclease family